jgi:diguanylate cyclase (GGDEF)-like protein/PAS domain S-box-containing protein
MKLDDIVQSMQTEGSRWVSSGIGEAIVLVDREGIIAYASIPFLQMMGYLPGQADPVGRNIFTDYPFEHPNQKLSLLSDAVASGSLRTSTRVKYQKLEGEPLYLNLRIFSTPEKDGAVVSVQDVTNEISINDVRTGVYSKDFYLKHLLPTEVEKAKRNKSHLGIIMADLQDFKALNDTYGHPAGDQRLRDVASLLKSNVKGTDFVVRYGGDEFLVLMPGADMAALESVERRMREAVEGFNALIKIDNFKMRVNFGYFSDNDNHSRIEAIADNRMYVDKSAAKGTNGTR